ncbi:MAG: metal-sensitive transcriptional regulator [Deltaproteobacteria bacterium]|nr:MAG: metal-sensitive transcriptional regulator [Deltaproteobacteria bacterium]
MSVLTKDEESYLDESTRKDLLNRLSRIEGHLRAVKKMVLEKRCADEILLQVAAVKAALNAFSALLIEHELKICVNTCMTGNIDERLNRVTKVFGTLLKQS